MTVLCLPHGRFTLIDDEDWEFVNQWKWHASFAAGNWYVRRSEHVIGSRSPKKIYLHRVLMRAEKGQLVDHKNHDTLDNRKSELRICTSSQNNQNLLKRRTSKSGFKGVSWGERDRKWSVKVGVNHVGNYNSAQEAAQAYDKAAIERYGEFACTNQSLGLLSSPIDVANRAGI